MIIENKGKQYVVAMDGEMVWAMVDAAILTGKKQMALSLLQATIYPNAVEAETVLNDILQKWQDTVNKVAEQALVDLPTETV